MSKLSCGSSHATIATAQVQACRPRARRARARAVLLTSRPLLQGDSYQRVGGAQGRTVSPGSSCRARAAAVRVRGLVGRSRASALPLMRDVVARPPASVADAAVGRLERQASGGISGEECVEPPAEPVDLDDVPQPGSLRASSPPTLRVPRRPADGSRITRAAPSNSGPPKRAAISSV